MTHNPLSLESIVDTIRRNGFSPELVDTYHNGTQTIKFRRGPLLYRVDPTNPPVLLMVTACQMDSATDKADLLLRVANEVNDSLQGCKVIFLEPLSLMCFQVEVICPTEEFFRNNFGLFMKIIDTTIDKFLETYDILKDKDKKILGEFTKALEPKGQDELPF